MLYNIIQTYKREVYFIYYPANLCELNDFMNSFKRIYDREEKQKERF